MSAVSETKTKKVGLLVFPVAAGFFFCAVFNGCAARKVAGTSLRTKQKPVVFSRQAAAKYPIPAFSQPLPVPLEKPKIEIRKQERKLYLFSGPRLLRVYPVKVGLNPVDDKIRQGDNCTPEGRFYVCTKNPRSRFHLSLGLSYPNIEDADRGLRSKLITQKQHAEIVRKIVKGGMPPWNTPLGGEIFIHGDGDIWDWTYGCVALKNKDIDEIFQVIKVGTEVVIKK